METFEIVFLFIILGILIWGVWKLSYMAGRHHDRMTVLQVIADLKREQTKTMTMFEVQCLLLDKLKYAWDDSDRVSGFRR